MARIDVRPVTSPDGRTVEVLTAGDPGGRPWLFHGGSPSAVAAYPAFDEAARRLGLRMVTYSRPGYGGSTPRPAPGRMVDDVEESVLVLDHLGIDRFLTLGWSGGGPRALACAALLPDRCVAAATLAGVAPYDAPGLDWFAGMAADNVEEYHAAAAGSAVYEQYLLDHVLPMLEATPEQVRDALGALASPADREALTSSLADWLSRTFRAAGAQGARGVRDDGLAAVAPWGFDLSDIRVPVAVWQGAQDVMVPYTHGEWLAAHLPGACAHLDQEEGHLSLVNRIEDVLTDLKRLGGLG